MTGKPRTQPGRSLPGKTTTLTTTTDPVCVPLNELICDAQSQVRHRLDPGTVHRYADAMATGSEFPPILIAVVNGAPLLIDGWHRVAAAKSLQRPTLVATVLDAPPEQHAWLAARENLKNGLPLRRSEARAVFRAYVRAGQHKRPRGKGVKSSREIAADLHGIRSHVTILNWMGQDFPRIRGMMGNDDDGHSGSDPANKPTDHESHMIAKTLEHLEEARRHSRAVQDPIRRGELIAEAEAIVAAMKAQGDWVPQSEPAF